MSKFLWNVLKISGGANAPPGCAPESSTLICCDDSKHSTTSKLYSPWGVFESGLK